MRWPYWICPFFLIGKIIIYSTEFHFTRKFALKTHQPMLFRMYRAYCMVFALYGENKMN